MQCEVVRVPRSRLARTSFWLCVAAMWGAGSVAVGATQPPPAAPADAWSADIDAVRASPKVAGLARWVTTSGDNAAMPFVIIDKVDARVFVFDAAGRFQAAAPALLGLAQGDHSVAGVGDLPMSAIRVQDRITPAGRFIASLGRDPHGREILWVDYRDAIALHPVVKGTPQERRAERLTSPTPSDNRISYGCINVPAAFYRQFISPAFAGTSGIVYIIPEIDSTRVLYGPDRGP